MRKKSIAFKIFFILIAVFFITACNKPTVVRRKRHVQDTSLARIFVHKKLIVGVASYFPPYVTGDAAQGFSGFDAEVAKEVAKALNVEIEFAPLHWEEMTSKLKNNEVDCLWCALSPEEFESADCIFSEKYINSSLTVMVLKDSAYESLHDLKNEKVGFLTNTDTTLASNVMAAVMHEFDNLTTYYSLEIALHELKSKKIDALVLDILTINYLLKVYPSFRMLNKPIKPMSYSVVFNAKDISLRNKMDEVLLQLELDGKLEKLSVDWFGANIVILGR